ncbi:hypothetical protein H5410_004393 [Solanum commersonii]|uniref:Uncharacterized protein n=1 Tax=Solanum commersonii TaxID=4109 RepID=A0A9J6B7Y8_SOLCO|nr:hypothetical protein H5410_004393 [Solanum commersonii]
MEEVKKDLLKNLDIDIKDDISMASASHTNEESDTCIAGEGQDVGEEEIDIETILKRYQQKLEESSSTSTTGKGKEKVVKTTEETITIDSDNQTFRLLSDNDLAP